ncbi:MAG TPA: VIT domain-containing protein, partial [Steroidobacteraceae bacterium]|nr:VIT domain-containing protein [Steroidobacteraceae bacterium]
MRELVPDRTHPRESGQPRCWPPVVFDVPSPVIAWRKATPHRRSTWRSVQIGAALLLACGLADAAEATELRNSRPDSGLMLYRDAGTTAHPALRLETAVRIQVSGIVARVEVVQRFENTADAWLEGVYVCPLPENASVDTLSIDVGGRKVVGEVREKSQAVALYQQASASGRRAGLVEQRRPNLFRTRIANIGPYEQVAVAIGYQQVIDQQAGEFRLRLPLAVTPRYRPEP